MIVLATTVLVALLDRRDAAHDEAVHWVATKSEELATTPLVLCEVDYLSASRIGRHARTAVRRDVSAGCYAVSWWPEATEQC